MHRYRLPSAIEFVEYYYLYTFRAHLSHLKMQACMYTYIYFMILFVIFTHTLFRYLLSDDDEESIYDQLN